MKYQLATPLKMIRDPPGFASPGWKPLI